MSEPKYTDPMVAYNTGYNDGQRARTLLIVKLLEELELRLLTADRDFSTPRIVGALAKLREGFSR